MSTISTHVLDTAQGRPAHEVRVDIDRLDDTGAWQRLGGTVTDVDSGE